MVAKKHKKDEIEALFQKYPDVSRETIIKSDIVRLGIFFTEAAQKASEGHRTKNYGGNIFAHDLMTPEEFRKLTEGGRIFQVPPWIQLKGGPYRIRGKLTVQSRVNVNTPYLVDVSDGKMKLYIRDGDSKEEIADLWELRPVPKYWSKKFDDGTPYRELSWAEPHIYYNFVCQHWGPKEECKFCEINNVWRMTHQEGVGSLKKAFPKIEQVAEVVAEIYREQREPEDRPYGVLMDGGAITKTMEGFTEGEWILRYITAVREKIGSGKPISVMAQAQPKDVLVKWYEGGATHHCPNIEVWDERLFNIICPGKARYIGRDEWVKRTVDAVDVFGFGNVQPFFVSGIEMVQPWGFKDVAEAVKSTTAGYDYLMDHGVLPVPIVWARYAGSAVKDRPPVPLEYLIEISRNWYDLMRKYRLPPPNFGHYAPTMGPGRCEMASCAAGDMEDEC